VSAKVNYRDSVSNSGRYASAGDIYKIEDRSAKVSNKIKVKIFSRREYKRSSEDIYKKYSAAILKNTAKRKL
jgi:hypothetical protein